MSLKTNNFFLLVLGFSLSSIFVETDAGLYNGGLEERMSLASSFDSYYVCVQAAKNRNFKDKYADTSNCHYYHQCYYVNETVIFGFRRRCPSRTLWNPKVLQCLPEGPEWCTDRCLNEEVRKNGCYAGEGCRQYFTCSNNKVSHGNCCPEGTEFVPYAKGCKCEISTTCTDSCTIRGLSNLTAQVSSPFNDSVCKDHYGNTIMSSDDDPSVFQLMSFGGVATTKQRCPPSLYFDLLLCRCNMYSPLMPARITQQRKALIWMPFDVDAQDKSVNQYQVTLHYGAQRDSKVSAVTGGGSLSVEKHGYLTIQNLKAQDFRNKLSVCLFFRCENYAADNNPYLCRYNSGILSNNNHSKSFSDYSFVLGIQRYNRFIGRFNFWKPIGTKQVGAPLKIPPNGWNQACVTYDGNVIRFYQNAEALDVQLVGGSLFNANSPFVIGFDRSLGYFNGHIDDILIAPFELTKEEITAHFTGNRAYLVARGFFLAA